MLRKACALSLLLLAFSPFTAPFSTCDLTTASTCPAKEEIRATRIPSVSAIGVDAAAARHPSEPPVAGRARFFVRSPVPPASSWRCDGGRHRPRARLVTRDLAPPGRPINLRV